MVISISVDGPVAVVIIDNPPVNAASHAVRQGLVDALAQVEAEDAIHAVVLFCAGRTFVAGADVREFGKPPRAPHLPDVVAMLETATKPWIAAIHGTALGGGLEIALGCHYRVADPAAKFGLPEVTLGLIPGAGGTVRLPRLVGPSLALEMMAKGKPIAADVAFANGLVDQVPTENLRETAVQFAAKMAGLPLPRSLTGRDLPDFDQDALSRDIKRIEAKSRGQNSPVAICRAISNAIDMSASDALAAERYIFSSLKKDPQSLALRQIFFAERTATKIPALADVSLPQINHVAVIGGGAMGAGIAAACLLADLAVIMIERDEDALSAGQSRVAEVLSVSRKRGVISAEKHDAIQSRFAGATDYAALTDPDFVIEAVFEDMDVKKAVFAQLDAATKPNAILASNTSYLDIQAIAQATSDPSRVIGLHFFSPAHIMKLLELIIPDSASPRAVAAGLALGKRLRKVTVPSGVCDGFIGNRMMSAYRRTCEYMIEDGAMPADVDGAMRDFGFPMGIFEMQDLAGNDISWAMRKRQAATRDPAVRYVDIADKLCEQGRFGRKTGRGWYRYDGNVRADDPEVEALILAESARKGKTRQPISKHAIMVEILRAMQSEGDEMLTEGIAAKASDIDVVMVNGYGFPRWHGGPMFLKS